MHLLATVCVHSPVWVQQRAITPRFGANDAHNQSTVLVCVSVIRRAYADNLAVDQRLI